MPRNAPASFGVKSWDDHPDIYPGSSKKGRRLVRLNRIELVNAGALARVGRELVIFVEPFTKWLQAQGRHVAGYECAANRVREVQSAKTAGGAP
jgi:hypothetical protein